MAFAWKNLTKPDSLEEGLFFDRKESYPVKTGREKLEFIRDAISFANISRSTGKYSYILIGVNDDLEKVGVPYVGLEPIVYWERYKRSLENIAKDYIEPTLLITVSHIDEDGKHFGCIEFEPTATEKPFQVKRAFRNKDNPQDEVHEGDIWIRSDDSKRQVKPSDIVARLNYQLLPWLLPNQWLTYCKNHIKTIDQSEAINLQTLYFHNRSKAIESLNEFINEDKRLFIVEGQAGSGKTVLIKQLCQSLIEQLNYRIKQRDFKEILEDIGLVSLCISLRGISERDDSLSSTINRHLIHFGLLSQKPQHIEKIFDLEHVQWLIMLDGLDECDPNKRQNICHQVRFFLQQHPRVKMILVSRPVIKDWNAAFPDIALVCQKLAPLTDIQIRNLLTHGLNDLDIVKNTLQWINENSDIKEIICYPMYIVAATSYLIPTPSSQPELESSIRPIRNSKPITKQSDLRRAGFINNPVPSENLEIESTKLKSVNIDFSELSEPFPNQVESNEPRLDLEGKTIEISKAVLLDRLIRSLWERELKKDANIEHKAKLWREYLCNAAWHYGGEHNPMQYKYANRLLSNQGLIHFLELGILREHPNYHLIIFFNHLVRCYYAASYIDLLACAKEDQKITNLLKKSKPDLRSQILELAKDLSSEDISRYIQ